MNPSSNGHSSGEMEFSLTLTEIPVTLGGTRYILREANGEAARKYRDAAMKAARFGPSGKVVGIDGAASVEPLLVSLCLYKTDVNGSPMATVDIKTIESWPARVVKQLFDKIKTISALDEEINEESPGPKEHQNDLKGGLT